MTSSLIATMVFWFHLVCLLLAAGVVVEAAEKKPNVVIFFVDDLGYGDLGCFGRKNVSTPNIDQMAKDGIKFTQWISAAPICTPSRAGLQTGRLPVRFGMVANSLPFRVFPLTASTGGIPDSEITIAQAMKQHGYRTGISGKWHLGISSSTSKFHFLPPQKGYDSWVGIPYTNMHQCKERPVGGEGKLFCMLMYNNTIVQQPLVEETLTKELTNHAVTFMEDSVNRNVPFLFLFSFVHVHTPLFTSPEFKNKSKGGIFGDNVEEMDHAVGVVLEKIEALGIGESTLIFFTSDNGPYAEEGYDFAGRTGGLKGSKAQTYEGGIRMPGIARWKGKIPAGIITDSLVNTMDIFPTVMNLIGARSFATNTSHFDGRDISKLLLNPDTEQTPYDYMFHYCGTHVAAVRQVVGNSVLKYHLLLPKWKNRGHLDVCDQCCPYSATSKLGGSLCDCRIGLDLTVHTKHPIIYNMTRDPKEQHPIAAIPDELLEQMFRALKVHKATVHKAPGQLYGIDVRNFPCCNGDFLKGDSCICNDLPPIKPSFEEIM